MRQERLTIMRAELVAINTALTTFAALDWIGISRTPYPAYMPSNTTIPTLVTVAQSTTTTTCSS